MPETAPPPPVDSMDALFDEAEAAVGATTTPIPSGHKFRMPNLTPAFLKKRTLITAEATPVAGVPDEPRYGPGPALFSDSSSYKAAETYSHEGSPADADSLPASPESKSRAAEK